MVAVLAEKMAEVVPIKPRAAIPPSPKNVAVPPKKISSSSSKPKSSVPATRSQPPASRSSQQQQVMMQMNPMQQQVGFPQDPNAVYQGMSQSQQVEQEKNDSLMANIFCA